MTTSISTSNPYSGGTPPVSPPASSGGLPSAKAVSASPGETQLRSGPAAVAGAGGGSPQPLVTAANPAEAPYYYFLESVRTTSPQVLPLSNLVPPGIDTGFGVPAPAGAVHPRAAPGHSAPPGLHLGSTVPATPGVELGAQPFVPAVPPASGFATPTAESLRSAPAFLAGAGKASPQPLVAIPLAGFAESSFYFLDELWRPAETPSASGGQGFQPRLVPATPPAQD